MQFGDLCRAKCSAPARYLGHGRCLFVSAMCNDLMDDEARPATGGEDRYPLPTHDDLMDFAERLRLRPS